MARLALRDFVFSFRRLSFVAEGVRRGGSAVSQNGGTEARRRGNFVWAGPSGWLVAAALAFTTLAYVGARLAAETKKIAEVRRDGGARR